MLLALLPGTTRREKGFNAELFRSRRMPAFCFEGPWQSKQFSRRSGWTSFSKSTFPAVCADDRKRDMDEQNIIHTRAELASFRGQPAADGPLNAKQGGKRAIVFIFKVRLQRLVLSSVCCGPDEIPSRWVCHGVAVLPDGADQRRQSKNERQLMHPSEIRSRTTCFAGQAGPAPMSYQEDYRA